MTIFLTPDLYAWHKPGTYPDPAKNKQAAQEFYVNKLRNSSSNRDGCRAYVAGSYYHNIRKCFPDAYLLDTSSFQKGESRLLRVVTNDENLNQVVEQTTVRVQRIQTDLWRRIRRISLPVIEKLNSKDYCNVRDNPLSKEECQFIGMEKGFDGSMYAIGKHVYQYAPRDSHPSSKYRTYSGTNDLHPELAMMSKSLSYLLSHYFHWETTTIRKTLESFDELPPACLGGMDGLTKSINTSVNLANAAHYDGNDLGVGVSVWIEKVPNHSTESYFILPNLILQDQNKKTRYGVIIKLCDGCAISWDGGLLRHCTSIRTLHGSSRSESELGDFYSVNFVNNGPTLSSLSNIRNEQYQEEMGDDDGEKDWMEFAIRKTDKGVTDFW